MPEWFLMTLYMVVTAALFVGGLRWCATRERNPLPPAAVMIVLMVAPWFVLDVFANPPKDAVGEHPAAPMFVGITALAAGWSFGAVYTWRTRSPLFIWSAIAGLFFYTLLVEPIGDFFVATWYPTNLDIVATVFGRPMPWALMLLYGGLIPVVMVAAYEFAKRLPPSRLLLLFAVVAVLEVPLELTASHFHLMNYYGNHAVVLGVPIYCFVQNGGFIAVALWGLAHLTPIRGWRWALVPVVEAFALVGIAIVATFPAYLAIQYHASTLVGWLAGILATVMNAAVVVACVYSPAVAKLRVPAPTSDSLPLNTPTTHAI